MKPAPVAPEAIDFHPVFRHARALARERMQFRLRADPGARPRFGALHAPEPTPPFPHPEPVPDDDMVPLPPDQIPGAPVREPGVPPRPMAIV